MEFQVTDRAMSTTGSKRSMTEHGYMLIRDCALSIAGVTEYSASNFQPRMYNDRDPNSVIRVYRSEATLAESVPKWYGSPAANDHPPGGEFFNTANTPKFQKGSIVGMPKMVGPILRGDLLVTDSATIAEIEAGKEELSCGYYSGYDFTPGIAPNGEPYDCEQLALRPNHVAVVAAGRCGSICKVSDSADDIPKEAPKMGTVTVNGVTYEATEQLAQVINALQAQLNELLAKAATTAMEAQTAVETAKTEAEAAAAQVVGLSAQLEAATNPDAVDAMLDERMEVLDHARKLIPNLDHKGKTNAQIRLEVVKAKCPDLPVKNLDSAEYVAARFDALAPTTAANPRSALDRALVNSLKNTDAKDDDMPDANKARAAAIARRQTAHLKPSQRK
jgi:hypothetical protein